MRKIPVILVTLFVSPCMVSCGLAQERTVNETQAEMALIVQRRESLAENLAKFQDASATCRKLAEAADDPGFLWTAMAALRLPLEDESIKAPLYGKVLDIVETTKDQRYLAHVIESTGLVEWITALPSSFNADGVLVFLLPIGMLNENRSWVELVQNRATDPQLAAGAAAVIARWGPDFEALNDALLDSMEAVANAGDSVSTTTLLSAVASAFTLVEEARLYHLTHATDAVGLKNPLYRMSIDFRGRRDRYLSLAGVTPRWEYQVNTLTNAEAGEFYLRIRARERRFSYSPVATELATHFMNNAGDNSVLEIVGLGDVAATYVIEQGRLLDGVPLLERLDRFAIEAPTFQARCVAIFYLHEIGERDRANDYTHILWTDFQEYAQQNRLTLYERATGLFHIAIIASRAGSRLILQEIASQFASVAEAQDIAYYLASAELHVQRKLTSLGIGQTGQLPAAPAFIGSPTAKTDLSLEAIR